MQREFDLPEKLKFRWIQLINAIPKYWKESVSEDKGTLNNFGIHDHHLTEKSKFNL